MIFANLFKYLVIVFCPLLFQSCVGWLSQCATTDAYLIFDLSKDKAKIEGFEKFPKEKMPENVAWNDSFFSFYQIPATTEQVIVTDDKGSSTIQSLSKISGTRVKINGKWHGKKMLTQDGRVINYDSSLGAKWEDRYRVETRSGWHYEAPVHSIRDSND